MADYQDEDRLAWEDAYTAAQQGAAPVDKQPGWKLTAFFVILGLLALWLLSV